VIGAEPFGGGFGADLVDARDAVGAVAGEREVIDDLFRPDIELGLHGIAVVDAARHGVDERDVRTDELRHVLVAGRDQHALAGVGGAARQRADHIVGLDARYAQQRQAERLHRRQQRFDLRAQVVGHRRSVRLIFFEELVAEAAARRVEHHREARVRELALELQQHVEHAEHGAGRLAVRTGERRQRVERTVEVGRAVDEDEVGRVHGSGVTVEYATKENGAPDSVHLAAARSPVHVGQDRIRCPGPSPTPCTSPGS